MHASARDLGQCGGIDEMFLGEDAGRQCIRRIVVQHGDGGLGDDRPFIHLGHDEMHRAAVDFDAIGKGSLMGMQAAIGGEQGRVNVEQPTFPGADEPGVSRRMKPARQINSIRCRSSRICTDFSNSTRPAYIL